MSNLAGSPGPVKLKYTDEQYNAAADRLKAARKNKTPFIWHGPSPDGVQAGKTYRGFIPTYVPEAVAIRKHEATHAHGEGYIQTNVPIILLDLEPDLSADEKPSKFLRRAEARLKEHARTPENGYAEFEAAPEAEKK